MEKPKIKLLKKYFKEEKSVILAFVFGSQAKGLTRKISDWDIGVYFKPKEYLELETERDYPGEEGMWSDLVDILETDNVDLVILNRARPELVFSILNSGIPVAIKDRELYLDLLCKTHYEAVDFRKFAFDFWKIGEKTESLSEEDRLRLLRRLRFLEKEWREFGKLRKLTWSEYQDNSNMRRSVERWIENLVMASLDIAKIILATGKELIPDSYRDTLKYFGVKYFNEEFAEKFSKFAELRNIVVHEYLDIKWKRIKKFIKEAERLFPVFIKKIKKILET